ncbi:extracellular solute-binding protein family 3 [Pseudodesulfovibrio mercurii]|uniref:Extracellular solute-binding protein family 3 n=1 Tax=Pseudodesulfovibrio mercurii TaxID=641491 RepID=F0JIE1_9BACT|nr:transporter substrate-binding domain-containing protein [Pseudodesulfovibrio mercurii]EGB14193.1 extracellular solute-binding protein family 3 [Pseudodesulfovibrio mercurii]
MHTLVLLLCLAMAFCSLSTAHAESIIAASDEWCPFNCVPGALREGYVVDILRAVFEPAGIAVDYRLMGWERAVEEGRRGHVSVVIGAADDEAEGFVFPEEEIGLDHFDFYVRAGDPWRYRGPESLLGRHLGIPAGYSLAPDMAAYLKAHKDGMDIYRTAREKPAEHNLRLLVEGRLDVIADDGQVIRYLIHTRHLGDAVEYAGNDGAPVKLYIAFSPADPRSARHAALFDKGMRALRKSGRLKALLKRYGLADWR